MTKEELKQGFSNRLMADLLGYSVAYIKRLKFQPIKGIIYNHEINADLIFKIALNNGIDLNLIDYEKVKKQYKTRKPRKKIIYENGTILNNGDTIINKQAVGRNFIYICRDKNNKIVLHSATAVSEMICK